MPKVTMPDGTSYRITAPEGMSNEEIANIARKHWESERESTAASALMQGGAGGFVLGSGGMGTTLSDLGKGAVRGAEEGVLGIGQAAADLTGAIFPSLRERATQGSKELAEVGRRVREQLPVSDENVAAIGELGGSMIPSMAIPGGTIAKGAFGGATALLPEGGNLVDRLVGGGLGAIFGKVLDLTGSQISRIVNAKGLAGKIDAVKDEFAQIDPVAAPLKQRLNATIARKWDRYKDLTKMATDEGDRMGALNVKGLADQANSLAEEAGKVSGQDAGAVKLLRDTGRVLAKPVNTPDELTVGGAKFTRDPVTGEYGNAAGDVLNDRLVQMALPKDAGPPNVRYKDLKAMRENIDEFLEKKGDSTNDAVKRVRELRAAIDARMDEVRTPQLAALEKKGQAFYDKELGKYDKDVVQRLLGAKDDFERAQIVISKIANNPKASPADAKDIAEMLGKPGREAVSTHMMHDAVIDAMDKKGHFDPLRFLRYFDDKPGFEPFKAEHFDEVAKGLSMYIKHNVDLQGESTVPGIGNIGRHALSLAMTGARVASNAAAGNMFGVVKAVGEYLAPYTTLSLTNRALQDTFLRHMFIVASRLPEGSPRWQRIMGQISSRFAGPVAGQVGQAGSEASVQMGQ